MSALSNARVRRIAVLGALNLVLAAGGWLALVSPQKHHAASAAQQAQGIQTQIAQLDQAAAPAPTGRKPPVIRTASLYRLAEAMPASADEPDLLLLVDQLAQSSGVKVTTLSISTPTGETGGYTILPITLDLTGSYMSLSSFLHRLRTLVSVRHGELEASGRLFSVGSITLAPASGGHLLTATTTVDAYVFGTVAGASPAPAPATTTSTTGTTGTTATTTTGG